MDFIRQVYVGILLTTSFMGSYFLKETPNINSTYTIKPIIKKQYYSIYQNYNISQNKKDRKGDKKSKNTILKEYAVLPRRLEDILDSIKIASQDKKD
ncbi:MAG: hypothetical protein PWP03_701 [Candidatus Woesearchaeota archaeon]|nr:hypothetical protein [Candidatus Woesearchaeota archaeon]MDN5328063.1 hypothetical protein [Candidatus Woesearchaeota archaeon]